MWPDRVPNPGPLTYESGALPTALRGPARDNRSRDNESRLTSIHRGYLLFLGEYQIYFIECVENISDFTSA